MGVRIALVCACLAWAQASEAAIFRAYLASHGNDANPCTLAQPCRLLPAALAAVAGGGEIWMLDSANYNTAPVTVAKSVGILAVPGAVGSVLAAGGDALLIETAGVEVALRNLVIAPLPGSGGSSGIRMTAGASLTVERCVIAGLPQNGVHVSAPATVRVVDTVVRDSGMHGIWLQGGAAATITRSISSGNALDGILVQGSAAGVTTADVADTAIDANGAGVVALSDAAGAVVKVSVRDSTVVRNTGHGLRAESSAGASVTLSASNNQSSGNGTGIAAVGNAAKVWASGNAVSGNATGLLASGSGVLESACDNAVRNNGTDASGPITGVPTACASTAINANWAFITSTSHAATLGGVAAYDAVCNTRATAAGLNDVTSSSFFAWLSTTSSSASARLGGTARGWVRTDGKPFADTAADLMSGRILYPLRLDEMGADVGADNILFTGTNADGTPGTSNCSNWTSSSGTAQAGLSAAGTTAWTVGSIVACSAPRRLICLGRARAASVAATAPAGARGAFVSAANFSPGGGIVAADALCAAEASAAGHPGTYRALLATTTASAAARFDLSGGTWARVDGVAILASAADLATGFFTAPLNVTAAGAYVGSNPTWVGASSLGVAGTSQSTCDTWTATSSATGIAAIASRSTPPNVAQSCATPSRIYCLQQ